MTGGEQSALAALASLTAIALGQEPEPVATTEEAASTINKRRATKRKADAVTDESQSPPRASRRAAAKAARGARASSELTSSPAPEEYLFAAMVSQQAMTSAGETGGQRSEGSQVTLTPSQSSGEEASLAVKRAPVAQGKPMYQCG